MLTNSVLQPPALNLPPVSVAASGSNGQGPCYQVHDMIWVSSYRREVLASEQLTKMAFGFQSFTPEWEAVIDGALSLHREACDSCFQATKRGLLLMLVVA